MKLARSTYYYRNRRSTDEKKVLQQRIAELSAEFPRYGYRRVTHQLRAEGLLVNHKAVAGIMRQHGLQVRPLRRFVRTTQSDHQSPISPNLAQSFTPTGPDQLWIADLTYVAISVGFVYVGVILDAWSLATQSRSASTRDWRWRRQGQRFMPVVLCPTVSIIRTGMPNTHQLLITRLWTITG